MRPPYAALLLVPRRGVYVQFNRAIESYEDSPRLCCCRVESVLTI